MKSDVHNQVFCFQPELNHFMTDKSPQSEKIKAKAEGDEPMRAKKTTADWGADVIGSSSVVEAVLGLCACTLRSCMRKIRKIAAVN